uniref:Uncharacterized protein n=1 Tax=Peronospora matthiolae TaxID=2874970 RepID=A0AAV1V1W5_9STRA
MPLQRNFSCEGDFQLQVVVGEAAGSKGALNQRQRDNRDEKRLMAGRCNSDTHCAGRYAIPTASASAGGKKESESERERASEYVRQRPAVAAQAVAHVLLQLKT